LGVGPLGNTHALALHVDDQDTAAATLAEKGFTILTEGDLNS
jgi:hypothetical protein